MTIPIQTVEKTCQEAVRDFEVSVTVLKMHAPKETHPLLDTMLEQFGHIAKLAVILAQTPFDQ